MTLKTGQIIKNLIPHEPVLITRVQSLGNMLSVTYTGVNSKTVNTKVVDEKSIDDLEILTDEGSFNFQGDPDRFLLYAEAERIHSAYQFDPLFAVNCSIIDPLPHQVETVYKYLLPLPKIRFLLADDTGSGKTIMSGLLMKELMMRGMLERVLIITPGGLTKQWQEDEMGLKFNFSFKLVNRAAFDSDPNIFSSSPLLITSIDFLRNDDVLNVVKETSWDMIIVDEAHKLSAFEYGQRRYVSKRYQVLDELSMKCDHLLLLTATPHRGRADTFRNLLQLLDKDIFASDSLVTSRVQEIEENGANKFFIRRLKEQIRDWNGNPLFKKRFTKTTLYKLTPEEKLLYDRVTEYLSKRRAEAEEEANIHVSLALMVMQRRLTSSIYAILRTLKNRYNALKGLLDELAQNPNLLKQKQKLDFALERPDDFDELDDEERESLENILSDPRKFKLFTTAKSLAEIRQESEQVRQLVDLAANLYNSNQEEQKYKKLRDLLQSQGVLDQNEKLVVFTEHKDTLNYLEERLRNSGYKVETIHGSKTVEERRAAQNRFARDAQILIATDAAGEGINLQFCRLLINWDIPWNPNRLEQRMGRIHRYGQKKDVLVFNLVAQNTREGQVLERLLTKLDLIREQIGDDRVYDVISDVFEGVNLDDIIDSTFDGEVTRYNDAIDAQLTGERVKQKIIEQKEKLGHTLVDYQDAKRLKEHSDEKRLQPIYIRLFFEKAFKALSGQFTEIRKSYLEEAFTHMIIDVTAMINDLQAKILIGEDKIQEKIIKYQQRLAELKQKKRERLHRLELMQQVNMKPPQVLGCAYVVPLSQVEFKGHYGMSRDDEAEAIAMQVSMDYEGQNGRQPKDVSAENAGYDICSVDAEQFKRYIEVKGRNSMGGVMLSENEMNRLAQLGNQAWLYIVVNCKTEPQLHRFQNPAATLNFEKKSRGVQYYLSQAIWQKNKKLA